MITGTSCIKVFFLFFLFTVCWEWSEKPWAYGVDADHGFIRWLGALCKDEGTAIDQFGSAETR